MPPLFSPFSHLYLAKITTYDVVINNWDRIPIVWDNKGNPENILFTTSRKRKEVVPFPIDNTITSIDPSLEENFSECILFLFIFSLIFVFIFDVNRK